MNPMIFAEMTFNILKFKKPGYRYITESESIIYGRHNSASFGPHLNSVIDLYIAECFISGVFI